MPLRKQTKVKIVFFSFLMCLIYWFMEELIHSSISHELFSSDVAELVELATILSIIISSGLYAGHIAGRYQSWLDESESNFREEMEKLSLAVEHSPASIVITDSFATIEYVNGRFTKITGYSKEEALGKNPRILRSGQTPLSVYSDLWKTILSGREWRGELLNKKKNGDLYWEDVQISSIKDPNGKITHFVGVKEDITVRKTLENRIRERERDLSGIIENMQDTYYRTDIEGKILFVSPSAEQLLGYSSEEAIGKKMSEFYFDPDERKLFLNALQERGGKVRDYEAPLRHKNGSTVWVSTNARHHTDDNGNIIGVEGTTRDITAKKEAEKAIAGYTRELEYSNRMKELFIDIMNHDLMNPVNIVLNSSEMLLEWENESSKKALIVLINESSKDLAAIVRNASKYSRLKSMAEIEMHEMDLNEILKNATKKLCGMAKEMGMTIAYFDAGKHPANLNPIIDDVFVNLISNAIKYGKAGQTIEAGITDDGDHWISFVSDYGEGINDEHKERVFERFERLERGFIKGQGLGLAICKRIVELHEGRIWIEDNPKGGSIFKVSLKKAKEAVL